jgi:phage-related protein (TIGR01555 family)
MSKNRMTTALASRPNMRLVDDPVATLDDHSIAHVDWNGTGGWSNSQTGFGTARDKTTFNRYTAGYVLGDEELSLLYHGDDLAALIVDIVPDEMLREGFSVDAGDGGLNADLAEQIEALGMVDKLADAIRWGRLYGGGALLLGADDGRSAATPLIAERAQALTYLYVFDKRYLYPLTWYRAAGHPKLGMPETYMVTATGSYADNPVSIIHETRLVLFGGATTGLRETQSNNGWDLSVLQRVNKVIGDFNIGWNAAAVLLQDGNQAVFKMAGLADAIAAGQGDALKKRLQAIDEARSVINAIVVDAGGNAEDQTAESFERKVFPMTGLPETLDRFCLRMSAAARIPVTLLMGQSPAGMNATGQADFQAFYNGIGSKQRLRLAPKIQRIARVMLATKAFAGRVKKGADGKPVAVSVSFPPLWTEAPLTAAQTRKTLLEGDAIATTNGYLVASEVATSRFNGPKGFENEIQISEEGKKARDAELEHDLDDLENPPEPEKTPTPGAGGFGGGGFGGKPKGAFGGGQPKTPFARADADDQPREENGQFASTDGGGGSGGAGKGGSAESGGGGEQGPAHKYEYESRQAARAAVSAALPEARVAHGKDAKPGVVRQASKEELGQVGQNAGAYALYRNSTNEVLLSEHTIRGAAAAHDYIQNSAHYSPGFIDKDEASGYGNVDHLYQLSVVHHEELHSMSRSSGDSYRGAGAVLEEVGTELAAMHVTRNSAPHLAKETSLRGHLLERSGYGNKVRSVQRVIEQHTGKKGDEALDAIRDAHLRSALNGGKQFATGADHVRAFTQALDVPHATREVIAAKLGRMRL